MRVSVVVCTFNRADALSVTLDALRYQRFTDFEVVVVNGPSTDHTTEMLDGRRESVKVVENPEANLSVSRNLGIRAAGGELVGFIDDDAIPEFDWLADIVAEFEHDPAGEVAGIGGLVFDHTGMDFQYRFAASSRLGEPRLSDTRPFDDLCLPGGFWFPYLQGTNAVFRRDVLDEVGGFDETFDYYLDETDLCARIVDAGYLLRQIDDAHVHHKFLPSATRTPEHVVSRWYPVIKNLVYFGYRHALAEVGGAAIQEKGAAELEFRVNESAAHEQAGRLPAGSADRTRREGRAAIIEGTRLGHDAGDGPLPPMALGRPEFLPYPVRTPTGGRTIAIVSSAYSETVNGGISRFITDVAPELARLGHEVRVITRSPDVARVDFEAGVWVHRIEAVAGGALPGTAPHIDTFATAALAEVQRIDTWRPIDVVYGPAWDMEVLPVIRHTDLPVVVHLATPVAVTNHLDEDRPYEPDPYASLLIGLETEIFTTADLLHANSRAVVDTINSRYGLRLDPLRVGIAPLGTGDTSRFGPVDVGTAGTVEILYVGRIEPRKGVDTLLEVFERLAPDLPWLRMSLVGAENVGERQIRGPWLERHAGAPWLRRVEFVGAVDDEELDRRYGAADIVAIPSRYESFGLTLVEAMRHGKPIVSTTGGAIPEVVDDGVTGLLVAPGDAAAMSVAIERLASDPVLRHEMGAAGRARFEREFTIEAAAERLSTLLCAVRTVRPGGGPLAAGEEISIDTRAGESADVVVAPIGAARARAGLDVIDLDGTVPIVRWRPREQRPGPIRIGVMRGRAEVRAVHLIGPS